MSLNPLRQVHALLTGVPRPVLWIGCLVAVGLIGVFDAMTGFELSMSIFYLIPVAAAAWGLGRAGGLVMACASGAAWLVSDSLAGHTYSNPLFPAWNTGVRLGYFLITAELVYRLRFQLLRERERADRDSLTGLFNGAAFRRGAQALIDLMARQDRGSVIGFIDLDDFKRVNDSLGHAQGDRLLVAVADCLRDVVRHTDLVGRIGGDEFAVLMADTDEAGARAAFERLRGGLEQLAQSSAAGVGFSAGLLVFSGAVRVEELLRVSDAAMYRVKRQGKGQVLLEHWSLARASIPFEAAVWPSQQAEGG